MACTDCNRAWRRDNDQCPLCNTSLSTSQQFFELRGFGDVARLAGAHSKSPGACSGAVENRTDAHPSAAAHTDSSEEFEPVRTFQVTLIVCVCVCVCVLATSFMHTNDNDPN